MSVSTRPRPKYCDQIRLTVPRPGGEGIFRIDDPLGQVQSVWLVGFQWMQNRGYAGRDLVGGSREISLDQKMGCTWLLLSLGQDEGGDAVVELLFRGREIVKQSGPKSFVRQHLQRSG